MFKDFKEFAVRGNVIDMAVGIIIGAAFTTIVQSMVRDIMMPPLGLITAEIDLSKAYLLLKEGTPPAPYESLQAAKDAGAVLITYGNFLNALISFFFVAFAVFLLIRYINKLKSPQETKEPVPAKIKKCHYCYSDIPIEATRCPQCTSKLEQKSE